MVETIIARPWAFLGLIAVLIVLSLCAALRTRHDMKLKRRTTVPRRKTPRGAKDRRWEGQRQNR